MLRNVINSRKLIEEVKKRPCLYDQRTHNNGEASTRKANWEVITNELFGKVFDDSNPREREALVREVQVKWKSLRDAFSRVKKQEREEQTTGVVKHRKKYIFYDQLKFLDQYRFNRSSPASSSSPVPTAIFIQESSTKNEDMDNAYSSSAENSNPFKHEEEVTFSDTQLSGEHGFETVTFDHTSSADSKVADLLQEIVKMQKSEKSDDRMGNKKFLLSLLPFMEKLPDDVNLEVRLQLMSVLQTYANGESFFKT